MYIHFQRQWLLTHVAIARLGTTMVNLFVWLRFRSSSFGLDPPTITPPVPKPRPPLTIFSREIQLVEGGALLSFVLLKKSSIRSKRSESECTVPPTILHIATHQSGSGSSHRGINPNPSGSWLLLHLLRQVCTRGSLCSKLSLRAIDSRGSGADAKSALAKMYVLYIISSSRVPPPVGI